MSVKFYVLGCPRCKPPAVSRGSPRLHFIIMFMLMQLFVCCDRNKVQFNSIYFTYKKRHPPRIHFRATDICIYYIYVNYFLKASITEADDTSTTKAFTYDTNTLNVVYLINKEL